MANSCVFFSDLKSGRSSSTVEVRLLRFWEARNIRCADELMSVDMLLVDTNATLVPATVAASRVPIPNFRLFDSSLLIEFSDATSLNGLTEPNPVLHTLKNAFHSVVKARCLL
ncbi:unnamed protein product [Brassica rapa]|uniref:Uncharacterized protein n=1 Tax=Brassica campestris TaxID=3711 RepID=A0A8D9H8F9_BRACM|nr:unnamed protein product [Brassica rapa]